MNKMLQDLSSAARDDFYRAVRAAGGENIYRLKSDRYFQDDGFMTHSEIEEHVKWWDIEEPGKDHSDVWDCVELIDRGEVILPD